MKSCLRPGRPIFSSGSLGAALALSALVCVAAQGRAAGGEGAAFWQGALTFRGAELPIRLEVRSTGSDPLVMLDVPSLVMAWEPIPAARAPGGLELRLPFGIGELTVDLDGDTARASKPLAGDRLELSLERIAPPAFTRREVLFESDGTELAGTLVLPAGGGPHPAAVLLHGSKGQGRESWAYRSWADPLVRLGLAVLYYDKRGVGDSGGGPEAGLGQLADDGAAAVRFLRSQPQVAADRVGLRGSSQGAWIARQIASDLGDVSFLMLASAAAGTPRQQELVKIEHVMRADGRSEEEIESALAYAGLYFFVAHSGRGWPLLAQEVRRAQAENWGEYLDQPRSEADLRWWRENHAFRPPGSAGGLCLPVLLLYGEADRVTPPVENAAKLRDRFACPERVAVQRFPGADHRLEVDGGRDPGGRWRWPQIAPGVMRVLAEWLDEQGVRGLPPEGSNAGPAP